MLTSNLKLENKGERRRTKRGLLAKRFITGISVLSLCNLQLRFSVTMLTYWKRLGMARHLHEIDQFGNKCQNVSDGRVGITVNSYLGKHFHFASNRYIQ